MVTKSVPVERNLFTIPSSPEEQPSLLGSRCKHCGEIIFPAQSTCPNCGKVEPENFNLSRKGRIVKSTIVRRRPPLYNGPMPYVVGEVELPEGINIPSVIKGWDKDEPPPYGLEVELALDKIEVDEDGNDVLMYVFVVV